MLPTMKAIPLNSPTFRFSSKPSSAAFSFSIAASLGDVSKQCNGSRVTLSFKHVLDSVERYITIVEGFGNMNVEPMFIQVRFH